MKAPKNSVNADKKAGALASLGLASVAKTNQASEAGRKARTVAGAQIKGAITKEEAKKALGELEQA